MPAQVATLAVGLVLKTGPFFAALGGTINKASSSLATFGLRLSAVTAPLVGLGVAIAKIGTDYETAFTGVLKAVEEATDGFGNLTDLGRKLRVMFRDLSMDIPMSAVALADLGAIAGQLGVAGEDLEGFVEIVAKLGVTTNLSAEEAATGFARLMTIMGTAQDQMDEMASTLVYLGNNTAAMETEILKMALRFAGTASIIGMSEKGILGLAAAMSSAQIRAEMGGTAISRVMIDMANAIAEGGDELKILANVAGLTMEEFATLFEENAEVAILAFVEGLAEMDEQGKNVFKVLEDLGMAEVRVRETLLKLAASHEKVREALALSNAGWEENIALDREFNLYAMTTKSLLELLKARFVDVAISIKDAFDPAIKSALIGMIGFLDGIVELARTSPELLRTMVTIAAVVAAIGPALVILAAVIGILKFAIAAILSPLGLLVSGLIALGVAVGAFIIAKYEIESFADAVIVFSGLIAKALDWIAKRLSGLVDFIAEAAEWGAKAIEEFARGIIGAAGFVIQAIGYIAGVITGLLGPGSPPAILPGIADWGREAINEFLHGMMQADFDILEDVGNIIAKHLRGIAFEDEDALTDALARAQVALAQVMFEARTAGQASAEAWENLRGAIQDSTGEIERYIHLRIALAQAEQELASAEEHRSQVMSRLDDERFEMRQRHSEALRIAEERVDITEANRKSAMAALDEERFQMELRHKAELREVDEEIEAAERALQEFREQSSEIPERFTRGRERQLQAELRAAQEEREVIQERHELEQEQFDIRKRRIQETVDAQVEAARQQQENVREIQKIETQQFEIRRRQIEQQLDAQVEAAQKNVELMQAQARWLESLISLRQKFVDLFGKEKEGLAELGTLWKRTIDDIMPKMEGLGDSLEKAGEKTKKLFGLWKAFWAGVTGMGKDYATQKELLAGMTAEEKEMYFAGLKINEGWEGLTEAIDKVMVALDPLIQKFNELGDPEKFAVGFAALFGAPLLVTLGPTLLKFGIGIGRFILKGIITALAGGISLGAIISAITPFIGVLLALLVIITLLEGKFEALKPWIEETIPAALDTLTNTVLPHLQEAFDTLTETLNELGITWEDVWTALKNATAIVVKIIGAILLGLVAFVVGIVNGIAVALQTLIEGWRTVVKGWEEIGDNAGEFLGGLVDLILGYFLGDIPRALEGLRRIWGATWRIIQGILTVVLGTFEMTFGTILGFVWGFVEGVIEFFQNLYDRLLGGSLIPDIINGVVGWFSELPGKLLATIEQGLINLYNRFVRLKNDIVSILGDMVTEGLAKLTSWVDDIILAGQLLYDDLVGRSIIPDMVRDINASLGGLNPLLGAMTGLTPATVPAMAGGFAGQLVITNYWDASLSSADRAELSAMMKSTVYGALGEVYGS